MLFEEASPSAGLPLAGCRVVERSRTVAAACAGRLLAAMGAQVVMLEPEAGSPLRFSTTLADDQSATISVPGKLGEAGYSLEISRSGDKLILSEAGHSSDGAAQPEM